LTGRLRDAAFLDFSSGRPAKVRVFGEKLFGQISSVSAGLLFFNYLFLQRLTIFFQRLWRFLFFFVIFLLS